MVHTWTQTTHSDPQFLWIIACLHNGDMSDMIFQFRHRFKRMYETICRLYMIVLYYFIWFGPDVFFYPLLYFLVGGFKHLLFSIRYRLILPIDFHIFQRGRSTTNHRLLSQLFGNIYHHYTPNVRIYTIHGSSGLYFLYYDGYIILHACESNRKHLAGLRTAAWTTTGPGVSGQVFQNATAPF